MKLDFLEPSNIGLDEWNNIYTQFVEIMDNPRKFQDVLHGKVMATLFFEPSTRTMLSFQVAMQRLGGTCIGFNDPSRSSMAKGENLRDTISVISRYVDIIVLRHPWDGAAYAASIFSKAPVINAGDGEHYHPTQALIDLITIRLKKGTTNGLKIGICGHLSNHRSVLAFVEMLSRLGTNTFYLVSTSKLRLPEQVKTMLKKMGNRIIEDSNLENVLPYLDVLYMTRIQKERIYDDKEYEKQRGIYILDTNKMNLANENMIVLHPLPRVDEISNLLDSDKRCVYFEQAEYGMYTRMALLLCILYNKRKCMCFSNRPTMVNEKLECPNIRCITKTEDLPKLFYKNENNVFCCRYCDNKVEGFDNIIRKNELNNITGISLLKQELFTVINKQIHLSEHDIKNIIDSCLKENATDESKHRLIVQWKDEYIHFKGHNIVFQPVKFIRALLNAYITFMKDLNIATLINTLCDVLSVFLIQLSKEEAMILVSLVHLSSIMLLEDENLYSSYVSLNMKRENIVIDKIEFEECIKSLVDKKILTIENGYYYVEEKIIYEKQKG